MTDQIVIDKIPSETISVPIVGTMPLIVHRFSEKAKRKMLDGFQGRKTPKTPLYRILGKDLEEWIQEQRHPFPDVTRSWENVARQLDKATDGDVSVSGETLRKWQRDSGGQATEDLLETELDGVA